VPAASLARSAGRAVVLAVALSAGAVAGGAGTSGAAAMPAAVPSPAGLALRPDEHAVPTPPPDDGCGGAQSLAAEGRTRRPMCAPTCIVARRPPPAASLASYARPRERPMD
jgi:hypothetical protein